MELASLSNYQSDCAEYYGILLVRGRTHGQRTDIIMNTRLTNSHKQDEAFYDES